MAELLVEAEDLTVGYDSGAYDLPHPANRKAAVEGISFSVERGEKLALIGANGAGKSTLLLALAGALLPQEGSLYVGGVRAGKDTVREIRRKAGMVFQNPDDQFFMPTVEEDICFGPRNYGLGEDRIREKLAALLKSLGIEGLKERSAHKLSGGEKRLAALAGILIMEPPLLLLDEPTSFLDPRSRRGLMGILKNLNQTMIIATHDLDMARDLCSRAIVLREGRIAAGGGLDTLLRDSAPLEAWGL
ncbi:MAG: energy-coupling factor ABC transporter ATP-binding protein [Treponema sp.]|jgi:cobalt/nickel transport system ATP-binding protein|nr:energy-coupling factor ABC transporter ATP-binding protein [Treponema sp.]